MGAAVIIGNVRESHTQELLRGHDEEINVLGISNAGGLLASAQICSRRQQVSKQQQQICRSEWGLTLLTPRTEALPLSYGT